MSSGVREVIQVSSFKLAQGGGFFGIWPSIIILSGAVDLPPEIRLMIYRHLLVRSDPLPQLGPFWSDEPRPAWNILRTCRLIYREASDVLYTENTFHGFFWYPCLIGRPLASPRIRETL